MSDELLFNKYEICGVIQGQTETVKKRVQSIPANTLLNVSEHDLVQALFRNGKSARRLESRALPP